EDGENQVQQDRSRILLDLILDISNELDINVLCHKILINVGNLTGAHRCSLFLARTLNGNQFLEAKLFDVNTQSDLEESMVKATASTMRLEWGVGVAGRVASTRKLINLEDAYQCEWFDKSTDEKTGYRTKSVACLPILNHQGDVIGVAQIVNKQNGNMFTKSDIEIFEKYLSFCGVGIQNAELFEVSVLEYKKNQLLLSLARSLFQEQMSLDRLIRMIITEAKEMLQCERCTVYLLDLKMYDEVENETWLPQQEKRPGSPSSSVSTPKLTRNNTDSESLGSAQMKEDLLVFDVAYEMTECENSVRVLQCSKFGETRRLDIAKHVAANLEVLNLGSVKDWCGEELEQEEDGFTPKSMLSLPIYNGQRTVIGVAQLINKLNGKQFDDTDISMFEAFAIFCGIGIHNTKMYESAYKLMAKQKVALDCLSYHATASNDDAISLSREPIPKAEEFLLDSYKFIDVKYHDNLTVKIVIRMFMDFNLSKNLVFFLVNTIIFALKYKKNTQTLRNYEKKILAEIQLFQVLCRWALSVKKNYRPVKYHNWRHGLNVCQTMFTMLKTGKMERFMVELEVLGLLVACLCHDLDHRGTNNAYQTKVTSPLAVLYSTSTMEHHHFDQGYTLNPVMKIVEMAILSTDLASYFEKRERFLSTADAGEIDWQSEDKKKLLCSMLMTAADVASIAKPWEIQHKLAKLVADEFFDQGDMEKLKLNITPIAMMDRERKDELPQMQVEFIDQICVPLYTSLSDSFPWIRPLLEGALKNREKWIDLAEKVEMGLTWIDHDTIEQPVEDVEVGTLEAQGLELTVETFKCKQDEKAGCSLMKKRSFRSLKSPVRPPVGFFNRKHSTRHPKSLGESEGGSLDRQHSPDGTDNSSNIVLSKVEQV
ncbi:cGMP-specific 3',5'-cyclic phosphodiesterase, partial [Eurytemora carolleeae]|uniref:cGMP-specific 3',5'-cyclic phosphodiesterase n=1 Tax=Eurytemora carolleeae TaxID=1294199 RepID=UPI000C763A38